MPPLEAWERVYIASNSQGTEFLTGIHGPNYEGDAIAHALTCQMCHNGPADNTFIGATDAHVGVVRDPSDPHAAGQIGCYECHDDEFGKTACDNCHQSIAEATTNSLHSNLWGEKAAIERRGQCTFEGSGYEDMFENKCGGCHTTCGQCHVSRPSSVGSGFPKFGSIVYSAHKFNRTPDMTENCTACHGSRVGTDYNGDLDGNERDVHRSQGFKCQDCHSGEEIHGDGRHQGEHYNHRYEVATMPRCENCHSNLADNLWHQEHVGVPGRNLQCQVCHSQPYKNCTNCHNLVSDGKSEKFDINPSVVQFKIAHNPSPHREEYDYAVVRHIPVDPGTYDDWGMALPGYLDDTTWKYSSPHNILRVTPQTTVEPGQGCGAACHNTPDSPEGWLLRESDLYDSQGVPLPDYEANIGIVITEKARPFVKTE